MRYLLLAWQMNSSICLPVLQLRFGTLASHFLRIMMILERAPDIAAPSTDEALIIRPFATRTFAGIAQ